MVYETQVQRQADPDPLAAILEAKRTPLAGVLPVPIQRLALRDDLGDRICRIGTDRLRPDLIRELARVASATP
jgi:hypothetical protein